MGVPLVKDDRLVAVLTAHANAARAWTDDELALIEDVAERTWAAVERARAEVALRTSEERVRLALDAAGMGSFIWHPEADQGEPDARMNASTTSRAPRRTASIIVR